MDTIMIDNTQTENTAHKNTKTENTIPNKNKTTEVIYDGIQAGSTSFRDENGKKNIFERYFLALYRNTDVNSEYYDSTKASKTYKDLQNLAVQDKSFCIHAFETASDGYWLKLGDMVYDMKRTSKILLNALLFRIKKLNSNNLLKDKEKKRFEEQIFYRAYNYSKSIFRDPRYESIIQKRYKAAIGNDFDPELCRLYNAPFKTECTLEQIL